MAPFQLCAITDTDRTWLPAFFADHWGSTQQVVRGECFVPHELPGFVATIDNVPVGVITYRFLNETTGEVTTLNSLREGIGIGGALVRAVMEVMRQQERTQLVVVTTNDNLHALRFYQRLGFVLALLRANALAGSRRIKPEIPLIGFDGIPLRDEIELTMTL